jgi:hypothetical protein
MEMPVKFRLLTDLVRGAWVRPLALGAPALAAVIAVLMVAGVMQAAPAQQAPGTLYVNSVSDAYTNCDGDCTLRGALDVINSGSGYYDTIRFDLAGAGPHVISVQSVLPAINPYLGGSFVIEGVNRSGGPVAVVLDGGGRAFNGLTLNAGSIGVYSMTIRNFGGAGVAIGEVYGNELRGNTLENNGVGVEISGGFYGTGQHSLIGNMIRSNDSSGVKIVDSFQNLLRGNQIYGNGLNGVTVIGDDSTYNEITRNDIHDNGGEAVDLNGDGATDNDLGDSDAGANGTQNFPVLVRARPVNNTVVVQGYFNSDFFYSPYRIELFGGARCDQGTQTYLPSTPPTLSLDESGKVFFSLTISQTLPLGTAVRATATSPNNLLQASAVNVSGSGSTSEYSDCVLVGPDNDSWPKALRTSVPTIAAAVSAAEAQELADAAGVTELDATTGVVTMTQYIDSLGQSRWFKFKIRPNSQLIVTLTGLPANYDLTLYKDIAAEYEKLANPQDTTDLTRLGAESAPQAFAPQAFAPQAFAPQAFAPQAFAPQAFAPQAFAPQAFAPQAFAPQAFAPSSYSPDAFGASSFSPWAFEQDAFDASSIGNAYNPSTFDPKSFTGAQTRSLIGVSAFEGTVDEGLFMNTWLNDGDFYIRVRGRDGAFSLAAPFKLTVLLTPGPCATAFDAPLPAGTLASQAGGFRSVILLDSVRLKDAYRDEAQFNQLLVKLDTLKGRPEVQGVVIDVSQDARVAEANRRADQYYACPYGKNVVAESIKSVVDAYGKLNPLEYIVIVGGDNMIPFFRYPDNALLGPESDYFPPVLDTTSSQASLRLNYVLSQDGYGASEFLSLNGTEMPVPDLAVGRLVETPGDILKQLEAYFQTVNGVPTAPPESALVTGYDFMDDTAQAVKNELIAALGPGRMVDTLITPNGVSPLDPSAWTAFQLDEKLKSRRYDLVFLAGHFAADGALAADFTTALVPTDILSYTVNMRNTLFYSMGCHSGYNVVNEHRVPNVTSELDWASVFAEKGVTWIGGTGFQYGDTEFIDYSERLYLDFTRNLRYEDPSDPQYAPVAIGKALVRAKQRYLAQTPAIKGIHEKSLLIPTIYGLPMFSIDFQGETWTPLPRQPDFTSPPRVAGGAGAALELRQTDITTATVTTEVTKTLKNLDTGQSVVASYLRGKDGIITNPSEPTLPLQGFNISVPDNAMRGVGFRGGDFCDVQNIIPLTGAPATEIRGVYTPFQSKVWFPLQPWRVNYYDVFGEGPGAWGTRLYVMPAQHRSTGPGTLTNIRRQFSKMTFRLFYSANTATFGEGSSASTPALADAPTIVNVTATPEAGNNLRFQARVVGNPAAGVHAVWVTWTRSGVACGQWESLDLVQSDQDTTRWGGVLALPPGVAPKDVRFIVQAVNGVGVVGVSDNMGRYYGDAGSLDSQLRPTNLTLEPLAATVGAFSTSARFAAVLRDGSNSPVADKAVVISVGSQEQFAVTDSAGRASVAMPLLLQPGVYRVRAFFAGDDQYGPSSAISLSQFTVVRQATKIELTPPVAASNVDASTRFKATLFDVKQPEPVRLLQQTVFFEFSGSGQVITRPAQTNLMGEASVTIPALPPGTYTLQVRFAGTDSYLPATVTSGVQPERKLYLPFISKR